MHGPIEFADLEFSTGTNLLAHLLLINRRKDFNEKLDHNDAAIQVKCFIQRGGGAWNPPPPPPSEKVM